MAFVSPDIETGHQARELATAMATDPRVRELCHAFAPANLPRLLDHVRTLKPYLPADYEKALVSRWQQAARRDAPAVPTPTGQSADDIEALVRATDMWDFRLGQFERPKIPTAVELLPPEIAETVYTLADDWGMRQPIAVGGQFDAVLLLGGLIRANMNRPASAAEMISAGQVHTRLVIGLSGDRRPSPDSEEAEIARRIGAPDDNEKNALAYGITRAFGFYASDWRGDWPQKTYKGIDGVEFRMVEVPPPSGRPRPGTKDLYKWLLQTSGWGLDRPSARILAINSPIYWVAGQIDALLELDAIGSTARIVTAGGAVDVMPPGLEQVYRSQHYLQEMKAGIERLPRLLAWADAH